MLMNKYNAKTETQLRFAERIEKEIGVICDFSLYSVLRGRGLRRADGFASINVGMQTETGAYLPRVLVLFHPLKDYLKKSKYLSWYLDRLDICVEIEDRFIEKKSTYRY